MWLLEGYVVYEVVYVVLNDYFSEEEQVKFMVMINVINGWNWFVVGFGLWVDLVDVKVVVVKMVV